MKGIKTNEELFDENGKYRLDEEYQEIKKLDQMLTEAKIPHTMERMMDGWQVCYPVQDPETRVMDAIQHYGSYGHEQDLLEIMGLLTPEEEQCDSVKGWLTAENVFERIKKHYEQESREEE